MERVPHTQESRFGKAQSATWTDGVAIVGMSGRFPGARDIDTFWRRLVAGDVLIADLSVEELKRNGVDEKLLADPDYVRKGTTIEDAEGLDAELFGMSPREAEIMDPQQRVFLESAWEALEHAGYTGEFDRVGVFGGVGLNTYLHQLISNPGVMANVSAFQLMLGNDKDFVATRAAYKLNLRGPAVNVQTACSTSLAAVHLACQSLLAFECELALAGGVYLPFPQNTGYVYMPGMILSRDGLCRPFDVKASGTVPSRGAGMVVLKRLSSAVRDNDRIYAVIRGSAWNNDGAGKAGYTMPSVEGQGAVIREALAAAGVDARRIDFIEAHGTATELGDPIEFAALAEVFTAAGAVPGACLLGAVKSNLGHTDVASGIAGLLKATFAVYHGLVPPTLHFEQANPFIPFAGSPFTINREATPWPRAAERWAGVSSFGIGGTNVHVILSSAPPLLPPSLDGKGLQVFPLSGRSAPALKAVSERLAERLSAELALMPDEVASTLQLGRRRMAYRRAQVAGSLAELAEQLVSPARTGNAASLELGREVVFLFPGQGQNFAGAARGLYGGDEAFRAALDLGAGLLQRALGRDVLSLLIGVDGAKNSELEDTALAQPLLFLLEYALAARWGSLGMQPAALVGHSLGELTAATIAGVFSFEDGLQLAVERGRLMAQSPEGRMLAVSLPADRLAGLLEDGVWLAADNSARLSVASGLPQGIEALELRLRADRIAYVRLATRFAFHSPLMADAARAFRQVVESVDRHAPRVPWLSNVSGTWIDSAEAQSSQYWGSQILSRVRFSQDITALADRPHLLVECGPGEVLLGMARPQLRDSVFLSSLGDMASPPAGNAAFLHAVARAWECGVEIDWRALVPDTARRRVALPTYPFERRRYWVDPTSTPLPGSIGIQPVAVTALPLLVRDVKREDIGTWFSAPFWRSSPRLVAADRDAGFRWLVLHDDSPLSEILVERLHDGGNPVVTVRLASSFTGAEDSFALDATKSTHWERLCAGLTDDASRPTILLNLWSRTGSGVSAYDTVVRLLQAAGRQRLYFEQIAVVTEGLQSVVGETAKHVERAELIGLMRSIPLEYRGTRCRLIDVEAVDGMAAGTAELILAELQSSPEHTEVAYRGGRRWLHSFAPLHLAPASRDPFRKDGTYVITGGLGGVGYSFAGFLLRQYNARVLLIGRTDLLSAGAGRAEDRRLQRFASLHGLGGEVRYFSADVADSTGIAAALAYAHTEFGDIHGVVHAAGLPGGSLIASQDLAEASEVRRSKVEGSLILAEALRDEKLDFLILCSSLTAVVSALGQASYAAGNSFQDAFASFCRNELGLPATSIGFDAWQESGMAVDTVLPAGLESLKQDRLRNAMTTEEGIEVICRVLAGYADAHVVVSTLPLDRLIDRLETSLPVALTDADPVLAESTELAAVLEIWRDLLGNPEITPADNFFALGGHSLLGTMVVARIRKRFGVVLSLRALFEAPTPILLAAVLKATSRTEEFDALPLAELEGEREEFEI